MGMLRRAGPVLIAALAIIVLAALVSWQIHSSRNQANAATVVAGYLAALTPARATAFRWRWASGELNRVQAHLTAVYDWPARQLRR
jgi:hypothetical protein